MFSLKVKRLDCPIDPSWSDDDGNAGLDIRIAEPVVLAPGEVKMVRCGFATEFPSPWVALLRDRSGHGKRGIHVLGGVIDANFRGEWHVILANVNLNSYQKLFEFALSPSEWERDCFSVPKRHVGGGQFESFEMHDEYRTLVAGERVCQAIFVNCFHPPIEMVTELSDSDRGDKMLNSSGRV